MAENSIEAVRAAEIKADEVTRAAMYESNSIVEQANNQAILLQNKAEDAAKDNAASNIAQAHKASQKALEEAMQALSGEMQVLCDTAREHQPSAVKTILASLVK